MASRSIERRFLAAVAALVVILALVGLLIWYAARPTTSVELPSAMLVTGYVREVLGSNWTLLPNASYIMALRWAGNVTYVTFAFLNGTNLTVSSLNATSLELSLIWPPWCTYSATYVYVNGSATASGFSANPSSNNVHMLSLLVMWCQNSTGALDVFNNISETALKMLEESSNTSINYVNLTEVGGAKVFVIASEAKSAPQVSFATALLVKGPYVVSDYEFPASLNVTPGQVERIALLVGQGLP